MSWGLRLHPEKSCLTLEDQWSMQGPQSAVQTDDRRVSTHTNEGATPSNPFSSRWTQQLAIADSSGLQL